MKKKKIKKVTPWTISWLSLHKESTDNLDNLNNLINMIL